MPDPAEPRAQAASADDSESPVASPASADADEAAASVSPRPRHRLSSASTQPESPSPRPCDQQRASRADVSSPRRARRGQRRANRADVSSPDSSVGSQAGSPASRAPPAEGAARPPAVDDLPSDWASDGSGLGLFGSGASSGASSAVGAASAGAHSPSEGAASPPPDQRAPSPAWGADDGSASPSARTEQPAPPRIASEVGLVKTPGWPALPPRLPPAADLAILERTPIADQLRASRAFVDAVMLVATDPKFGDVDQWHWDLAGKFAFRGPVPNSDGHALKPPVPLGPQAVRALGFGSPGQRTLWRLLGYEPVFDLVAFPGAWCLRVVAPTPPWPPAVQAELPAPLREIHDSEEAHAARPPAPRSRTPPVPFRIPKRTPPAEPSVAAGAHKAALDAAMPDAEPQRPSSPAERAPAGDAVSKGSAASGKQGARGRRPGQSSDNKGKSRRQPSTGTAAKPSGSTRGDKRRPPATEAEHAAASPRPPPASRDGHSRGKGDHNGGGKRPPPPGGDPPADASARHQPTARGDGGKGGRGGGGKAGQASRGKGASPQHSRTRQPTSTGGHPSDGAAHPPPAWDPSSGGGVGWGGKGKGKGGYAGRGKGKGKGKGGYGKGGAWGPPPHGALRPRAVLVLSRQPLLRGSLLPGLGRLLVIASRVVLGRAALRRGGMDGARCCAFNLIHMRRQLRAFWYLRGVCFRHSRTCPRCLWARAWPCSPKAGM